jgi:hypothetical protein
MLDVDTTVKPSTANRRPLLFPASPRRPGMPAGSSSPSPLFRQQRTGEIVRLRLCARLKEWQRNAAQFNFNPSKHQRNLAAYEPLWHFCGVLPSLLVPL